MRWRGWILLAVALSLAACGKSAATTTLPTTAATSALPASPTEEPTTSAPSTPAPETSAPEGVISGTWKGSYESKFGPTGPFTATFEQSGSGFTGTIIVQGSTCVSHGTLAGSVTGTAIEFGAVQAEHTVAFKGTINGDIMSGTYAAPTCGPDSGTWSAHRA